MAEGDIDTNEQLQHLKQLRTEIGAIKKELNKLNKEKEGWFSKRSDVNKEITKLIGGVKGSKEQRNEITGTVQELKTQRDALNKEIAEKVKELKALKPKDAPRPSGPRDKEKNPGFLKKNIEKTEYLLETQPMSFKKEQQLMKQIKQWKKDLKELSAQMGDWEKINALSREISKLRRKSNAIHKKIQSQASESQDKHEVVLEKSKEIDELKEKEQAAFKKFKEYKELFTKENNKLKALLKEADEVRELLEENNVVVEEERKRSQAAEIKQKAKEVQKKMKTGGKLTTEDLLVMQKSMKR